MSVISAPAPNLSAMDEVDEGYLKPLLEKRIEKIFQIAAKFGHKTIILGAWGCGAFGNDPDLMSKLFAKAIKDMPWFKHVCFAIFDKSTNKTTLSSFKVNII